MRKSMNGLALLALLLSGCASLGPATTTTEEQVTDEVQREVYGTPRRDEPVELQQYSERPVHELDGQVAASYLMLAIGIARAVTDGARSTAIVAADSPSGDNACDRSVTEYPNGKYRPSPMHPLDFVVSEFPTRPPDEVRTATAGSRTTTTKIWRRITPKSSVSLFEPGTKFEEILTEVRDPKGRLVEGTWKTQPMSEYYGTENRYSPEDRLIRKSTEGPANQAEEHTYEYDADGNLLKEKRVYATGGTNSVTETTYIREGGVVVLAISVDYYDGPGVQPEDRDESSTVVTYEYDDDLRLVASRTHTLRDGSRGEIAIKRYSTDCE